MYALEGQNVKTNFSATGEEHAADEDGISQIESSSSACG